MTLYARWMYGVESLKDELEAARKKFQEITYRNYFDIVFATTTYDDVKQFGMAEYYNADHVNRLINAIRNGYATIDRVAEYGTDKEMQGREEIHEAGEEAYRAVRQIRLSPRVLVEIMSREYIENSAWVLVGGKIALKPWNFTTTSWNAYQVICDEAEEYIADGNYLESTLTYLVNLKTRLGNAQNPGLRPNGSEWGLDKEEAWRLMVELLRTQKEMQKRESGYPQF